MVDYIIMANKHEQRFLELIRVDAAPGFVKSISQTDGAKLTYVTMMGTFEVSVKLKKRTLDGWLAECIDPWVSSGLLGMGGFTPYDIAKALQSGLLRLGDLGEEFEGTEGDHEVCTEQDPVYHIDRNKLQDY